VPARNGADWIGGCLGLDADDLSPSMYWSAARFNSLIGPAKPAGSAGGACPVPLHRPSLGKGYLLYGVVIRRCVHFYP